MVTQWSEANTCHSCILASTWSPAWTTQCFQKCTNIIKYHVVKKIKTKKMQTHQSHQTQKKEETPQKHNILQVVGLHSCIRMVPSMDHTMHPKMHKHNQMPSCNKQSKENKCKLISHIKIKKKRRNTTKT